MSEQRPEHSTGLGWPWSAGPVAVSPGGNLGWIYPSPQQGDEGAVMTTEPDVSRETQPVDHPAITLAEPPTPESAEAVDQGLTPESADAAAHGPPPTAAAADGDVSRETFAPSVPVTDVSRETGGRSAVPDSTAPQAEVLPRPTVTRVMTIANQKGGVGKTTTTVNLSVALAMRGLNVLVIDLDPQGNASTGLGVDHHAGVPSVYDVLINGAAIREVEVDVPDLGLPAGRLTCVPATIDLAGAEIELVSLVAREFRLQRAIATYLATRTGPDRLDYLLVDCPPSLGLLTVNALSAAAEVLVPIQCEYYALEGLGQLLANIDLVRGHLNPSVVVSTILLTMYDARTRLAEQVAQEVRTHFGPAVLRTIIPRSVRVSEAPSYRQSVMTYDPSSRGALSYLDAARELAARGAAPPSSPAPVNEEGPQ